MECSPFEVNSRTDLNDVIKNGWYISNGFSKWITKISSYLPNITSPFPWIYLKSVKTFDISQIKENTPNFTCACQGVRNARFLEHLVCFFFVATVLRFNFLPYYRRNIRIQPKVASNIETFTYVDNLTTVLNMRQFCYR